MPTIKGYGRNVQNFDKSTRRVIVAPPGYVIWQIDQAGAEALIVAYLCHNARFRSLFLNNIKPHVYVALFIDPKRWASKLEVADIDNFLSSPIPELKNIPRWKELETYIKDSDNETNPQDRIYYIGKTCCHLLNYDATWPMFQITALKKSDGTMVFTNQQAQYYRDLYRNNLFPELTYYHADIQHELQNNGRVLRNLFGYPRRFGGSWDRELFKQGYAFKPQSTVGCITITAGTEIQDRMDNDDLLLRDTSIWQNGHDSLMGITPIDNWEEVCNTITPHIERDLISPRGEKFKMKSGLNVGFNWGGYDTVKNPRGLQEPNDFKRMVNNSMMGDI